MIVTKLASFRTELARRPTAAFDHYFKTPGLVGTPSDLRVLENTRPLIYAIPFTFIAPTSVAAVIDQLGPCGFGLTRDGKRHWLKSSDMLLAILPRMRWSIASVTVRDGVYLKDYCPDEGEVDVSDLRAARQHHRTRLRDMIVAHAAGMTDLAMQDLFKDAIDPARTSLTQLYQDHLEATGSYDLQRMGVYREKQEE